MIASAITEVPSLSVSEALERVLAAVEPVAVAETVPLRAALGRVLAADVPAPFDVPPFANSAMDGYALRAADITGAARERPVTLAVIGEVATGVVVTRPVAAGQAYRILTGAPLPPGADTVVPYEQTDGKGFGGWATAAPDGAAGAERRVRVFAALPEGEHVRVAGEDQRKGEAVLRANMLLRPAEIGVLASLGAAHVLVRRRPRVAILSTGNELTPAGTPLRPGLIYDANAESLGALVEWYGGDALSLGIARDTAGAVLGHLRDAVRHGADLILTSGGVSVGNHDVVKAVLAEHGEIDFWSVAMRPGRPLVLGRLDDIPVLGLPGNPVSVMVAFELFVRPALLRLAGHTTLDKVELLATALEPLRGSPGRETYLRGVVSRGEGPDGEWRVRSAGGQGSGMLTSMSRANALIRLAGDRPAASAGERVPVLMLDWPSTPRLPAATDWFTLTSDAGSAVRNG